MKILQIITLAECGGAQVHLLELLKGLKSNFEFLVIVGCEGFLTQELDKLEIAYKICPSLIRSISTKQDFKALCEIQKIIQEFKPDLIHCHSSKAGVIGRLAAFWCKIPSVFTAHGWAYHPEIAFLPRTIALISEIICSWLCKRIICVSEFDHKLALNTKLIPKHKLITIYNGITEISPAYLTKQEKNKINIIMLSRFAPPKRPDLLIKAFSQTILKTKQKICLLFVGDGPQKKACEELAQNYGLQNNIQFLGEITPPDKLLVQADIFALISDREGLPISLLEAMRAGLPLIASRVGGIPEIIQNHINGYLVSSLEELKDKLFKLIENPNQRKIFARNSKQIFEQKFKAQIMLEKTKNIYLEII